jgi:uncharacterized membrane protein
MTAEERETAARTQKLVQMSIDLLGKPFEETTEIERRVLEAVLSRMHVSRPVHREMEARLTLGDRLADRIAEFGGSWAFIGICFALLAVWVGVNTWILAGRAFDPFPYILLNLILSCLAAVQAPVILMSQNRLAEKDRLRAVNDYEVNLKAELEILQLHEKIDRLRAEDMSRLLGLVAAQQILIERLASGDANTK